jgi:putative sigma-54 modulation protein
MHLTVTGRHVAIDDRERAAIAAKVEHLDRVLNDNAVSAACVVSRERGQFACELAVHARGGRLLVGVGRHRRLEGAATRAVEKVSQQAQKLAGRWKSKRHDRTARAVNAAMARPRAVLPEPSPTPRVIRSRGYDVKPMTVEDAVLLLTGGGLTFLVFRDAASDAIAVVYKRPDGHVGLIEPRA